MLLMLLPVTHIWADASQRLDFELNLTCNKSSQCIVLTLADDLAVLLMKARAPSLEKLMVAVKRNTAHTQHGRCQNK